MSEWAAHIVCDDQSHAPKVAKITQISHMPSMAKSQADLGREYGAYGYLTEDGMVIVDGRAERINTVFGGASGKAPAKPLTGSENVNQRQAFTCPLCGRRIEWSPMTADRIGRLLHKNGITRVSLRGLAAIL